MIKEITIHEKHCDICNTTDNTPSLIGGYGGGSWSNVKGKDLCYVCSGLLNIKLLDVVDDNILDGILGNLKASRWQEHTSLFNNLGFTYA